MEIAIDSSPLTTAHKVRGIGTYTELLINALKRYESENTYTLFTSQQLVSKNTDVIHYTHFDLFANTLNVYKNKKIVLTVHDVIPLVFPEQFPSGVRGRIAFALQKRKLKMIDAIITDSECSKKDIHRCLSIPTEKIHVVYLGKDHSFNPVTNRALLERVRKKNSLPSQFLLYVGDVNWNKNVTGLIALFGELVKQQQNLQLVLSGHAFSDETLSQTRQIIQQIKKLHLENKVKRIGYIPLNDHVVIYNLASIYVQPSFYEGFGLPVLEALACGVPVVSSDKGSLPEVGGNAVSYADPAKPETFIKQITVLLHMNPAERKKRIEEGKKRAASFTLRKMANETLWVYKKVSNTST